MPSPVCIPPRSAPSGSVLLTQRIRLLYFPRQVRVTVLDKNDSPPQFLDTPFAYNVSEDLEIGHTIATLRAHDPDTLGSVTFLLMDGHDGKFLLEPASGKLLLNDTLDRETKSKYELRLRVSDGVQYTEAYATIEVRSDFLSAVQIPNVS